jgi:hypothetical protein
MSFAYPDTMPPLSLNVPKQTEAGGIELNENLLKHWIQRLPKNNIVEYLKQYIDALKRFNTNQLDQKERLKLLDLYRQPITQLIYKLSKKQLCTLVKDTDSQNSVIEDITLVLSELAVGYKIIIVEANSKLSNLKLAPVAQLAINRTCEQLSYLVLHCYKHYRVPPARVFNELHQLYQLTLASAVEELLPVVDNQLRANTSFKELYSQLILVAISNPYGLHDDKVLSAYHIMSHLASEVDIAPLPPTTKATPGHFYINCLSDRIPTPSVLPMIGNQIQPPALVFNTKPVLSVVDTLFQQSKLPESLDVDINLLKQLAPFLNTSYERKQPRVPVTGNHQTYLAFGMAPVQTCLSSHDPIPNPQIPELNSSWEILNKNQSGYLVTASLQPHIKINTYSIGDFIGLFEINEMGKRSITRVGFIRWIRIDRQNVVKMGLSLIEGDVVPVIYSTKADSTEKFGLMIPEILRLHQPASLITSEQIFTPDLAITLRPKGKRFAFEMKVGYVLSEGNNYQQLSLTEL